MTRGALITFRDTFSAADGAASNATGFRAATPLSSWLLKRQRALIALLVAAVCVYHAVAIADFGLGRVDGALYPLVDDDVMISMRFGRNLASGNGLVYNPGERVEGFTNPLLTVLTGALHLLPIAPRLIPGVIMLMNLLISAGIVWMLSRFWGDTPAARIAGLFAAFFYVALPHHMWHAHAGYEVYLQMAILLYSLWRLDRLRPVDALVLGLLPLTHATAGVMWAILVLAIFAFTRGTWTRAAGLAILAVLPLAAYEVFRLAYYGETLPNTFYLKAGAGTLRGGIGYTARWAIALMPVAIPAMYAVLHRFTARGWLMATLIVVHGLSVISIGGDILPQFRFLLPCSVLLTALAGAAASEWLGPQSARNFAFGWPVRTAIVAFFAVWMVLGTANTYRQSAPTSEMQRRWNIAHIAEGIALRDNTRPDDIIALFGLGFTGYFGERFTIDMLGKADYYIARLPPIPGRYIGHNKSDAEYVVRRSPAYAEMNMLPARFADVAWMEKQLQVRDGYGYTHDLALLPAFRERYDMRLVDLKGRRVPFAARKDLSSAPWRVPEAFYENQESWLQ